MKPRSALLGRSRPRTSPIAAGAADALVAGLETPWLVADEELCPPALPHPAHTSASATATARSARIAPPNLVDAVLESQTASGPGWHRYGIKADGATDGYGDCYVPDPTTCSPTGEPWFTHAVGSGHLWPLLTGERAEQDLQSGDRAAASGLAVDFQRMTWGLGYVPEQVWEDTDTPASPFGADPTTASIGFSNGKAAGSAAPLIWGQAQYLRLVLDLQAGTLIDQPQIIRARYLDPAAPADVPVTIASPANGTTVTGANTVVTGTTIITAAATVGAHATGWAQESATG